MTTLHQATTIFFVAQIAWFRPQQFWDIYNSLKFPKIMQVQIG